MRWTKRIAIALLLLAGLHLLVWFVLIPRYAPALLERVVTNLGAQAVKIGDVRIEWGALAISEAQLDWSTADEPGVIVQGRNIELSFTLDSLQRQTFTRFRATELSVRLPSTPVASGTGGEEKENPIRTLASVTIPFSKAEVGKLMVEQEAGATSGFQFEGALRWDEPALTLDSGSSFVLRPASDTALPPLKLQLAAVTSLKKVSPSELELSPTALELEGLAIPSAGKFSELTIRFDRTSLAPLKISGQATFSGNAIPAHPKDSPAVSLSGSARFEIEPHKHLMPQVTFDLQIPLYAVGVELRDISVRGKVNPTTLGKIEAIALSRAQFRALGAEVSAMPFSFRIGAPKNEVTTNVKALSLQRLFEVYPQTKFSGEGILDGEINLRLDKAGAIRATGALVSRPEGGVLRGDLSDWRDAHPGNRGIAIAAEALEQFHYTSLQSDVEYQPNGDLLLKIALKGANPDFNRGQQMNLNVSVEENLPALLKTIKYLR